MPIHDWTRVEPGDFHHFHQRWIQDLAAALNGGVLPPQYMALAEKVTGRPIPDVVALHARPSPEDPGGVAVATAPPTDRVIARFEKSSYAKRADRVVIRHGRGKVVAIIEIHKAIWDEFTDEPFEAPPGRSLTVASYIGGDLPTAYVESVRIGDLLPSQPIFLSADRYVPAPLEATYEQAWKVFPSLLKQLVEPSAG